MACKFLKMAMRYFAMLSARDKHSHPREIHIVCCPEEDVEYIVIV